MLTVQRLLPPSAFEVPTPIASQPSVPSNSTGVTSGDGGHIPSINFAGAYDGIVCRQAAEIERLREDCRRAELNAKDAEARLTRELELNEAQHIQQIAAVTAEKFTLSRSLESQISSLQADRDRLLSDHERITTDLQTKLKQLESVKQKDIDVLERKLSDAKASTDERRCELEKRILEHEHTEAELKQIVTQLKTYVAQSDSLAQSSGAWKQQLSELTNKCQMLESDNKCCSAERDTLKTRLDAMTKILAIHEQQLSQESQDVITNHKCLLTRWREKVYELMVQLKSAELTAREQTRLGNIKMMELNRACMESRASHEVLTHTLRDRQAVIDMLQVNNEALINQKNSAVRDLENEKQAHFQTVSSLHLVSENVKQALDKYSALETVVANMVATLKSYNNRISFAAGRMELMQAHYARREAMLKSEVIDGRSNEIQTNDANTEVLSASPDLIEQLVTELERVGKERDDLAALMKADSEKLSERILTATKQTTEEVNNLRETVTRLHEQCDEKSQKLEDMKSVLEACRLELEEAQTEIETLKLDLARLQMNVEKDIESARAADAEHHKDEVTQLERQLNDAKREQTKTVVTLRQLERQMERMKEKTTEHLQTVTLQHQRDIAKITEQLKQAETDNNLLLATLRQEGLMSRVRQKRALPAVDITSDRVGAGGGDRKNLSAYTYSSRDKTLDKQCDISRGDVHRPQPEYYDSDDAISPLDGKHLDQDSERRKIEEDLKLLVCQVLDDDDCDNNAA